MLFSWTEWNLHVDQRLEHTETHTWTLSKAVVWSGPKKNPQTATLIKEKLRIIPKSNWILRGYLWQFDRKLYTIKSPWSVFEVWKDMNNRGRWKFVKSKDVYWQGLFHCSHAREMKRFSLFFFFFLILDPLQKGQLDNPHRQEELLTHQKYTGMGTAVRVWLPAMWMVSISGHRCPF